MASILRLAAALVLAMSGCVAVKSPTLDATALVVDAAGYRADTLRLVRNGSSLELYAGAVLSRTVVFSALDSITVNGSADDDTLQLDFAGGNPIPTGGLKYHGNANVTTRGDVLELQNGQIASTAYRFFNPTDGAIEIDGRTVTYTGLEPIVDSVPSATLTVNGTNAANSITYRAGSGSNGLVGVDGFETVEFANKAMLVINGQGGDDTIVLDNSSVPSGLTTVGVTAGHGNDMISVTSTPVPVAVNGDAGDDVMRVAPSVTSTVTFDGGAHLLGDLLLVDATAAKSRDTGSTVEVDGFQDVNYVNVERSERVTKSKQQRFLKNRPVF